MIAIEIFAVDTTIGARVLRRRRQIEVIFITTLQSFESPLCIGEALVEEGIDGLNIPVERKEEGC